MVPEALDGIPATSVLDALHGAHDRIKQAVDFNEHYNRTGEGISPDDENGTAVWQFTSWTRCTCGHVYAASYGHKAESESQVTDLFNQPDDIYISALEEVAAASDDIIKPLKDDDGNGMFFDSTPWRMEGNPTSWVSNATTALSEQYEREPTDETRYLSSSERLRHSALTLLAGAIERVEQREREDMERVKNGGGA